MLKVENAQTWGFEGAIRGARNPMNSWHKMDSEYKKDAETGEVYYAVGE